MTELELLTRIAERLDEIADRLDGKATTPKSSQTFDEFARYYFDTFRKRKVTPYTFRKDTERYNAHICPTIGETPFAELRPDRVQKVLDRLENRPKTAREVFTLINIVCKTAIKHGIISQNPCDMAILPYYERRHGRALTADETRRLLTATDGTDIQRIYALALYTGLRPNEYATARIQGLFVIARNSKQKDGREHTKRIPITAKLAPYVKDGLPQPRRIQYLRNQLKQILPTHKLYDLRTTFYTRCQECGVSELARNLFMGHTLGGLADTYTDVSDEYLIAEAQKLNY